MPPLLSSLEYGAFLAYSPKGQSDKSRESRVITYAIKNDGPSATPGLSMIQLAVRRLKRDIVTTPLASLVDPAVTLVPLPRSAPLQPKSLWPALRICEALRAEGFGRNVLPCLKRVTPVPRSSFSARGHRPLPDAHLDSMAVDPPVVSPERITLVDDVVTKGSTLLAGASLIKDAFPNADVRAFALIRTLGLVPDIDHVIQPVLGTITEFHGEAERNP